jgi:hypothetical protein
MRLKLLAPAALSAAGVIFAIIFLYLQGNEAAQRAQQAADEAEAERKRNIVLPDLQTANRELLAAKQLSLSLVKGAAYLAKAQSPDGAWRSDVYATFKDGTALTPLVVVALQDAAGQLPESSAALHRKGCEFLAKLVKADGTIDPGPDGLDYPVYTAALTIRAFSHPSAKGFLKQRDAWVKYLKERQLTTKLGWKESDKQYGGWGYCRVVPTKPEPNMIAPPLIESNLSATRFALEALDAAGQLDEETAKVATIFVRRCQNQDGGFHFIYDDPVRNKAGAAKLNPLTFHSYGSTTADGLRCLILCGFPADSEWRAGARQWLVEHFRADAHPGEYVKAHESNRDAVYFYYVASVSRVVRDLGVKEAGKVDWAAALAKELVKRQREDGSWANPVELVRENDPIVATASALSALAHCRP